MRWVDYRVWGWMDKGYIHEKMVKIPQTGYSGFLVLRACPENIKEDLREQNKTGLVPDYLFEEDLSTEEIEFLLRSVDNPQ